MRAKQFLPEDNFGTNPKRPNRPGSRPERGHETKPRYVTDRKTGKQYDPDEEFNNLKNSDEFKSQMKRMATKEGAKVDRMIGHIKASEKKLGKSDKDAEAIAYATANKRGYLNNKNKKKRLKEMAEEIARIEAELAEGNPTSKKICLSNVSDDDLGASQLASCKSQGYRARSGKKSHLIGHGKSKVRITVGGKKIKGKEYGGPLPDYGTRKGQ